MFSFPQYVQFSHFRRRPVIALQPVPFPAVKLESVPRVPAHYNTEVAFKATIHDGCLKICLSKEMHNRG